MTFPALISALLAIAPHDDSQSETLRYTVTAVALHVAVTEQLPRWHGTRDELTRATLVVIGAESGMALAVHDGSKRGGKAVCIGQIEPSNGLWREYAATHEQLAGVGYDETLACVRTVVRTLASARALCRKQRYITNWAAATFTHYATGNRCKPSRLGWKRAKAMRGIRL
jgi:hypothetical protein